MSSDHVSSSLLTLSSLSSINATSNDTLSLAVEQQQSWWQLSTANSSLSSSTIYVISDHVPISSLSSYGIIGLYLVVVLAAGRFIRLMITDISLRIMYEDLPNPDPVLRLCRNIILAREFGDFETEETLFWQLITLFRSPEKLREKTKFM